MNFEKYLKKIKEDYRFAVKVEWLNPDESVNYEFTNALYDINVNLNVNYQNGCRRTCTIVLNNDNNQFPIDFNHIWFAQKFKLWMGIYIDDETPYYLPQGVFYVNNPSDVYDPSTKTVTLNGIDKWAYLDGTLNGKLTGVYQTNVDTNLYDAIRDLLRHPIKTIDYTLTDSNLGDYFTEENGNYSFKYDSEEMAYVPGNISAGATTATTTWEAKYDMHIKFDYSCTNKSGSDSRFVIYVGSEKVVGQQVYDEILEDGYYGVNGCYDGYISKGETIQLKYVKTNNYYPYKDTCKISNLTVLIHEQQVDPLPPRLSSYFLTKTAEVDIIDPETEETTTITKPVLDCPYTAKVEGGKTYADVLLEYATILCANIYYDVHGRLVLEPRIDTADDITDTNKEILWHYTVDEKTFLGLTQTYNFDKVYNDFIVLGNVVNGYQFKGRVQNRNPMSDTCIQKIGLKSKEPREDNQYVSDEQCVELAKYDAKMDTIIQKSGTLTSITMFHLDVNKLVTVSTPNNNMSKELFLISGFSLSTASSMSLNLTSVNVLKDFTVVEAEVYE